VPDRARCVLLMGGGWGLGPLPEVARALAGSGCDVLAVAGVNRRLHTRLCRLADRVGGIVPFARTDRVPELMAAADAVVTTPGQTCHEARVVGRPLVVLDVVPGHGRENTQHELESGAALACSPDAASVLSALRVTFEQPEPPPWPVRSARDWQASFLGALEAAGVGPFHPDGGTFV
jgi:UDP-N-acetylglucosamine:LPS N-acetylglucosamine transferase